MKFSRLSNRSESEAAIVRNSSTSLDSSTVTMDNSQNIGFQNMNSNKNNQDSFPERAKSLLLFHWRRILLVTLVVVAVIIIIAILSGGGSQSGRPISTVINGGDDLAEKQTKLEQKFEDLQRNFGDMQQKLQDKDAKIKDLSEELNNVKASNAAMQTSIDNFEKEVEQRKEIESNLQTQVSDNYHYMDNFKNSIWIKLAKLEKAMNLTVAEITSAKANHQEFSDNTMKILSEISESLTSDTLQDIRKDGNVTDVNAFLHKLKNYTSEVETCINPVQLNISSCEASSERSLATKCDLAIDGSLKTRNAGYAWESRGRSGGVEWIKVILDKPARITSTKILQRFEEAEALTKIRLDFEEFNSEERLKALTSTHWNSITLPHSTPSSWMKTVLLEANSWGSNGFKEIRLYGCYI